METRSDPVLAIEDLHIHFLTSQGVIQAVNGISLAVPRSRTLALVGESGCGKTVTAYAVLNLIEKPGKIVSGSITVYPQSKPPVSVTSLGAKSELLYRLRGEIVSIVFQEPMTALSPVHTIGSQVAEAVRIHRNASRKQAEALTVEMFHRVGIPSPRTRLKQYPYEISGGMRQRIMIAMALICRPELLIADEPTTALDVTIQAEIMNLMKDLQKQMNLSVLLITHDLGLVAQNADEVAVMYLGKIVEQGPVRTLIKTPRHPYTKALLKSLPGLHAAGEPLESIQGSVPSGACIPEGCPFHPRCRYARRNLCDRGQPPALRLLSPHHQAACLRVEEIQSL